jgi:phosphatidylinositol kinase/protein kinase (PI-3  family)
MLGMAPDYDHLTVLHKVEVFEYALDATTGDDLSRVLWLKSRSSEVWLERRTAYTRSTAVMSMVGYLLGLGDRHPSNLMLDRYSGKLLHIDFGDCFEASMHRDKFPERVPFRLTRMMILAMEVSGVEGSFRATSEHTLRVLRAHRDSVMAMLEAFVHDPLINWRLLSTPEAQAAVVAGGAAGGAGGGGEGGGEGGAAPGGAPGGAEGDAATAAGSGGTTTAAAQQQAAAAAAALAADASEALNERAVAVMRRMSDKLMGRDFAPDSALSGGAAGPGGDAAGAAAGGAGAGATTGTTTSAAGAGYGGLPPPHQRIQGVAITSALLSAMAAASSNGNNNNAASAGGAGGTTSNNNNNNLLGLLSGIELTGLFGGGAEGGYGSGLGGLAAATAAGGGPGADSVPAQVQRLILQATNHESLAVSYVGWCSFW